VKQHVSSSVEHLHDTYRVRLLLRLAVQSGASLKRCLAGSGVDEETLDDPLARISGGQVLTISANVAEAVPEELGVAVAYVKALDATALGPLGLTLMCKATLYDALETLVARYLPLAGSLLPAFLEEEDDELRVVFDDRDLRVAPAAHRQFVGVHLAGTLTVLEHVLSGPIIPKSVELRPPAHPNCSPFDEIFKVSPSFERPRNALTFWRSDFLRPLPLANGHTEAAMEEVLRNLLAEQQTQQSITGRIRTLLQRDLSRNITLEEVAASLSSSRRSITRRLEAEGYSFRALLEETRRRAAEQILAAEQISIDDIAGRVGYADRASFIRAFKRWHGVTPVQWRNGHGEGPQRTVSTLGGLSNALASGH
jgi:AraC-like DNA-binding protein